MKSNAVLTARIKNYHLRKPRQRNGKSTICTSQTALQVAKHVEAVIHSLTVVTIVRNSGTLNQGNLPTMKNLVHKNHFILIVIVMEVNMRVRHKKLKQILKTDFMA
jgi:hypothetical protein